MLAENIVSQFAAKLRDPLVLFGLAGQCVFMMRFLLQWYVSERLGRSHVPIGFWYLSILGGVMLMIYAIKDVDLVVLLGQTLGLGIYTRNLVLIHRRRSRAAALARERGSGESASSPPALSDAPL
jgi:lipid-A-disaccharide synthase-like uncharacterized protein